MQARVTAPENHAVKTFNFKLCWDTGKVFSIEPEASLIEAAQLMKDQSIGSILVLDYKSKEIIGMITDRDIALSITRGAAAPDLKVRDVMSNEVVCASDTDDFFKLVHLMTESGIARLPLRGEDGHIIGVVTVRNLLEILTKSLFELTQISKKQQEFEQSVRH